MGLLRTSAPTGGEVRGPSRDTVTEPTQRVGIPVKDSGTQTTSIFLSGAAMSNAVVVHHDRGLD
jgi:hypothetical protein